MKRDGQQFHQSQQNEQSPLTLDHWTIFKRKKNATYDDEHPSSGLKHAQTCDGV